MAARGIITSAGYSQYPEYDSHRLTLLQRVCHRLVLVLVRSHTHVPIRPGFGLARPDHPASINYNHNISAQTTRWAIVEWMKPENRTNIWAVCSSLSVSRLPLKHSIIIVSECHRYALQDSQAEDTYDD